MLPHLAGGWRIRLRAWVDCRRSSAEIALASATPPPSRAISGTAHASMATRHVAEMSANTSCGSGDHLRPKHLLAPTIDASSATQGDRKIEVKHLAGSNASETPRPLWYTSVSRAAMCSSSRHIGREAGGPPKTPESQKNLLPRDGRGFSRICSAPSRSI